MKNLGKVDNPLSVPRKKDLTATAESYAPVYIPCYGSIVSGELTADANADFLAYVCREYMVMYADASDQVSFGVPKPALLAPFDASRAEECVTLQLCGTAAQSALVKFCGLAVGSDNKKYLCTALMHTDDGAFESVTYTRFDSGVFIATYDSTTFAEVQEAYNAGELVFAKISNGYWPLTAQEPDPDVFIFSAATANSDGVLAIASLLLSEADGWKKGAQQEIPKASDTAPLAPGTAAPGESNLYSRGDHVHPSDDTKLDKNNPKATGSLTVTTQALSTILSADNLTLTDPNGTGSNSVIDFLVRYDEQGNFSPYVNITRLVDPTHSTQPATKKYVDDLAGKIFVAEYGVTTQEQIEEAYNAGKIPMLFYGNSIWTYTRIGAWPGFVNLTSATHEVGDYTVWDWRVTGYFINNSQWTSWLQTYLVPQDRKINGKALSSDITLGAMYSATLTSAGWTTSGDWKTQTVSVTGLKATYNAAPFVDVSLTGTDATGDAELAAAWLGISETLIADTAANSITIKFPATVDTPTANIPITITTYD